MPDLGFVVEKADAVPYAAAPLLGFTLRVTDSSPAAEVETIHSVTLRCQIRIEPAKRRYSEAEQGRLKDLFGEPARWGQTLRTMLWAHTSAVVPPFSRQTSVELQVPCSYDFNLAATKLFHALEEDVVPLVFLFSGTVFYAGNEQALQVAQIPWEKESSFRLPVSVWRKMMDLYYPNTAWLSLRQDVFDRLFQYKSLHGLPTWEDAIDRLIGQDEKPARP